MQLFHSIVFNNILNLANSVDVTKTVYLFLQGPPGEQGPRGEAGAKGDKVRDPSPI